MQHIRTSAESPAASPSTSMDASTAITSIASGTAVTAAIREKAPDAEIVAVRVFDRALATTITSLVAAIDWAANAGVHVINLSLGTPKPAHQAALRGAVDRASSRGAIVVSAREDSGARFFPGSLGGVLAVQVDWDLPRDGYRAVEIDGAVVFYASGFPREIPGVPPERNLQGISFAVANMTGFAARALESIAPDRSFEGIVTALRRASR